MKYQVAEQQKHFKKIVVIAPVFRSFRILSKDRRCHDYSYGNVDVHYPRCFYKPLFWLSRLMIDSRPRAVMRTIERRSIRMDLIHAHFTWPSGSIALRVRERYGSPVITTIHENGDWLYQEMALRNDHIDKAWSDANALIRVNRKDVPLLQKYNDQVISIPNGFSGTFHPIETTTARKELGLPEESKIIFSLGNLIVRKGFNYLIDAMKGITGKRDDVLCFIGGSGPEEHSLQKQIDDCNLNNVKLLGTIPKDELAYWMNACDIFVLPSLSEGNPTVMFEALGCGKPFVGTNVGGVPEIITSDAYGLLVRPKDVDDLQKQILAALDKKWNREAILDYSQSYTWENITKVLLEVYEEVLERAARTDG